MPESLDNNSEHVAAWRNAEKLAEMSLGQGHEGEVILHTYNTEQGEMRVAQKEVSSLEEAQRGYGVYTKLKEAGLPVANFYKIRTYTNEYGNKVVGVVMEDLSEGGKYTVEPASQGTGPTARDEVAEAADPTKLKKEMVRALAVMHNNGIYDFHLGISLFVRSEIDNPQNVDFLFLDYTNMEDPDNPRRPRDTIDFDKECIQDRVALMQGIGVRRDEEDELVAYYQQLREQGIKTYSA